MEVEAKFDWVPFYMEFADKIAPFQNDRTELISRLHSVYDAAGLKLPKLDYGEPKDVDPFTVFGLFNKGITNTNRTKICINFKKNLDMQSDAPTVFDGVPVLNNLSATYYRFEGERGDSDIDNLWNVFKSALAFASNENTVNRETFISAYDYARQLHGVKWNLTMGLHWIRPTVFVDLDSRNRWALGEKSMLGSECANAVRTLKNEPPDGAEYLRIRDMCKAAMKQDDSAYSSFPEFSYDAWKTSERVNEETRQAKKADVIPSGVVTMGDEDVRTVRYWMYSPAVQVDTWHEFSGNSLFALGWGKLGDLGQYNTQDDIAQALQDTFGGEESYKNTTYALWQFVHDVKPGDVVFAKRGTSQIIGRGIVSSDYRYDETRGGEYRHVRSIKWTNVGEWECPLGVASAPAHTTLMNVTPYTDLVEKLKALFASSEEDVEESKVTWPSYTKDDFLSDVYIDSSAYSKLVSLIEHKRNVILQGAPGVGKTFMAKRLAYSMMGCKDQNRVELVQFHQSYSYEDFIMGYRPSEEGFELKRGTFYEFCKRAESDSENDYFFIIDEINRGNLSKIFGELFMLIEPDKRGVTLKLLYADELFSVPANLYLIGTMNTADRSLAMLDYALRRRFAFYELEPGFESQGFREYQTRLNSSSFDQLIACVESLNGEIENDESLGHGFRIGHSYFCGLNEVTPQRLSEIVEYELIPLLQEYWFDDIDKVRSWSAKLNTAISEA